jgi:hypothetical protein
MGWPLVARDMDRNPERAEADLRWRADQPATRVSGLDVVESYGSGGSLPRIGELYRHRAEYRRHRHHWSFEPFANLFIGGLLTGIVGDSGAGSGLLAARRSHGLPRKKGDSEPDDLVLTRICCHLRGTSSTSRFAARFTGPKISGFRPEDSHLGLRGPSRPCTHPAFCRCGKK